MKLFLLFRIGPDHYALDAGEIAEVLPLTTLKHLPEAPHWVSGLLARGDDVVPVIDVNALATGTPAASRTSTRTVLVHYRRRMEDPASLLGLRLEYATETLRCEPGEFVDSGLAPGPARYLGPVRNGGQGLVQWVRVNALLPDDVHAMLFPGLPPNTPAAGSAAPGP
ncbi:chemotaxis protein CheW [Cupriavidus basilensis]|uniref:Chemotaxis protein CheW n=1 Tax=Cupriavidus basilensis TaxID=68895 RepID=A0ABT6AV02_9BURK|nr:chemotaxis protein CheW [Cupriavidus basilensis]MDF3836445.1 chemotaxis protein CheW [Cupriavidus basilensis]